MPTTIPANAVTDEQVQIATFLLGDELYGIDVHHVQEINRMVEVTTVPRSPEFVEGVSNLRGRIIPVINLRKRLGLATKQHDQQTRLILLNILDNAVAMTVDSVGDILTLSKHIIESGAEPFGRHTQYVKRIAKVDTRSLILLDLAKIIDFKTALITETEEDYEE